MTNALSIGQIKLARIAIDNQTLVNTKLLLKNLKHGEQANVAELSAILSDLRSIQKYLDLIEVDARDAEKVSRETNSTPAVKK